jgi:hypothetical protein
MSLRFTFNQERGERVNQLKGSQDANSATAFDKAYEWYTSGPRQRLQPGGRIVSSHD